MMDRIRNKDSIAMKRKDSRLRSLVFSTAAPAMVQEERLSLVSDRVHDADGNIPHVTFLDMELQHICPPLVCNKVQRVQWVLRFNGFYGEGAAHKNREAPQSINNGDAQRWYLVTSH
ncbi:Uncharacterised protein [Bacteroides xylanisolvens]|nr:Uncharacterised protein [Bacteroides xylanisolvens]